LFLLRAAEPGNENEEFSMEIDFNKMQGLAPAVIQDATTAELLMVGFMNREALEATLRTGFVTFYSRTRQTLWTKRRNVRQSPRSRRGMDGL